MKRIKQLLHLAEKNVWNKIKRLFAAKHDYYKKIIAMGEFTQLVIKIGRNEFTPFLCSLVPLL